MDNTDKTIEADDIFGNDTDAMATPVVEEPVEPKEEVSSLIETDGPTDDQTEEEYDAQKAPAKVYAYINPNVKQGQRAFSPIDNTKSPWKYQVPLAGFNHTFDEANELTDNPYYMRQDASYDTKWVDSIRLAQEDGLSNTFFGPSLSRAGSNWGVKVEHEGQKLGAHRPKAGQSGDGEKVTGLKAVSKIQALLGLGGMVKVPLWHSGIYISLKAPTDIQLLNFYETISREKIELGKNTAGLIFSNSSAYVNSAIYDLAVECIFETSVKDCAISDLKELILMNDFAILAWALAYSIFPNGYSYVRPCIVKPEACQHVVESLLDIGKLLWVDRAALNEKQRRHMSLVPRNKVTVDQVKEYQKEFTASEDNIYDTESGIAIVFKQPTIEEHLDSGARWIDELDSIVREVFRDEIKQDNINRYISERASLTQLRSFAHYIKHIAYTDDNSTSDDTDTLERLLNQLSSSPDVVNGLITKLNAFIDKSAISLVGLPRVPCPKCGEEPQESMEESPWIIPLNPVRLFFRLRDRKLQQSIPS